MIKPEDLEASDRHFVEQVMLSIRMLRGEIGQGDGGDARMQRAYALVLMREALGVLDSIRDTNCTPHLHRKAFVWTCLKTGIEFRRLHRESALF